MNELVSVFVVNGLGYSARQEDLVVKFDLLAPEHCLIQAAGMPPQIERHLPINTKVDQSISRVKQRHIGCRRQAFRKSFAGEF